MQPGCGRLHGVTAHAALIYTLPYREIFSKEIHISMKSFAREDRYSVDELPAVQSDIEGHSGGGAAKGIRIMCIYIHNAADC